MGIRRASGDDRRRYFGDNDEVLSRYARFDGNTHRERAYPVAQLSPNQ